MLDEPERGLTAEQFRGDPPAWRAAAEDFGVSTLPVRAEPGAAQEDAERCRAALVEAGWADQSDAEVSAVFDHDIDGWRGSINLDFGLLQPVEHGDAIPYKSVIAEA